MKWVNELRKEPLRVADAPANLRDDKHFMITALQLFFSKYHGHQSEGFNDEVLRFASPRLRADKEFVTIALDQSYRNIKWVDSILRDDKDFILLFMRKCTTMSKMKCVYEALSVRLRRDVDIGCASIRYNESADVKQKLRWLDAPLRENHEFLMCVAKYSPLALEFLPRAQDDAEILREAIRHSHGVAFAFASERWRRDDSMTMYAVRFGPRAIQYTLCETRKHIMEAVTHHGRALRHVGVWNGQFDVVLAAVRQDPTALQYASRHRRRDENIIRVAVDGDRRVILFALGAKSNRVPPFLWDPQWERAGPIQTRLLLLWWGFPPELSDFIAQLVRHAHMNKEARETWVSRYTQ